MAETKADAMTDRTPRFLRLPGEIRNKVYPLAAPPAIIFIKLKRGTKELVVTEATQTNTSLHLVCRQLYFEASSYPGPPFELVADSVCTVQQFAFMQHQKFAHITHIVLELEDIEVASIVRRPNKALRFLKGRSAVKEVRMVDTKMTSVKRNRAFAIENGLGFKLICGEGDARVTTETA